MEKEDIRFLNRFNILLSDGVKKNKRNIIVCSIITLLITLDIASLKSGKLSIQGLNLSISQENVILCLQISLIYFLITFIFNVYTEILKAHLESIASLDHSGSPKPPISTSIPEVAAMYPECVFSLGQYKKIKSLYHHKIEKEIKERVNELNLAYQTEIHEICQKTFMREVSSIESEESKELLEYISNDFTDGIHHMVISQSGGAENGHSCRFILAEQYTMPLKEKITSLLDKQNKQCKSIFTKQANIEFYIYPSFHIDSAIKETLDEDIKLLSRFKASFWSLDLAQLIKLWLIDTIIPVTLSLTALLSTIKELDMPTTFSILVALNILSFFFVFKKYRVNTKKETPA
ncbi:hypothetical protein ACE1K8_001441 [Vibrio parahaemolyticus]|nr:hypothetical protein [Vibrio parahaemolyticus]HCE2836195.1 hypothetical protein [Vibrio parahaemolyticus]